MKLNLPTDYSYLSNYFFSISLALFGLPGLAFAQPFLSKENVGLLFTTSIERFIIMTIIVVLAVASGALGLYFAGKNKQEEQATKA